MQPDSLLFSFFLIFTSVALLSTIALFFRQPLLVAYIVVGVTLGPYGLSYVSDLSLLNDISEFGIIFLLFLLGLDMQPTKLFVTLKKTFLVTLISSLLFILLGYSTGLLFSLSHTESLVIGFTLIFSSTIIGIKLLPTTVLHQKHMGEIMVGILLMQDFIAIFILAFLDSGNQENSSTLEVLLAFPVLLVMTYLVARFVLISLIARFDHFREYIFLLAIGWCLGIAELAAGIGLSAEIGAFVAGVSLATNPISQFIAYSLKPLRDFFLVLFFFSLGAQFNIGLLGEIIAPALTVIDPQDRFQCGQQVLFLHELEYDLPNHGGTTESTTGEYSESTLPVGAFDQIDTDVMHLGGRLIYFGAAYRDLEFTRQVSKFRVKG